jgi:hypothetical protein
VLLSPTLLSHLRASLRKKSLVVVSRMNMQLLKYKGISSDAIVEQVFMRAAGGWGLVQAGLRRPRLTGHFVRPRYSS